MGRQGGGFGFFLQGGGSTFCSREGEGYLKIAKRAQKMHFLREFWKFVQNMCNFAFLRHTFYDFYLQYGEIYLVRKGGVNKKISLDKGGSIKCPAGGGIRTLPFRREGNGTLPPPCPRMIPNHKAESGTLTKTFLKSFQNYLPSNILFSSSYLCPCLGSSPPSCCWANVTGIAAGRKGGKGFWVSSFREM